VDCSEDVADIELPFPVKRHDIWESAANLNRVDIIWEALLIFITDKDFQDGP
jgi:hypothetical protein